jgi:uncharacterized MnhB-related membrane protein
MLRQGLKGIMDRIRPNILTAMILSAALGGVISVIGWRMGAVDVIASAGTGTIIVMSNLAMKILEKD